MFIFVLKEKVFVKNRKLADRKQLVKIVLPAPRSGCLTAFPGKAKKKELKS